MSNKPKPKQNRRFYSFYFRFPKKQIHIHTSIWIAALTFRFTRVNTKMRFNLYIRGCRFGIKEGWLLPFWGFKWLKPNLIAVIPHESYTGKTRQVKLHSYYTQSFNQTLVTSPKSGSQVDPGAPLSPSFSPLTPA